MVMRNGESFERLSVVCWQATLKIAITVGIRSVRRLGILFHTHDGDCSIDAALLSLVESSRYKCPFQRVRSNLCTCMMDSCHVAAPLDRLRP